MKKALSIILSVILLLTIVPVGTIGASAEENDVIEIRTIAELFNINNNMSGNYKLMNDIDMTEDTAVGGDWDFMGNGWEPIGSDGIYSNIPFTGTFDGNGHQIIGMRINCNTTPSGASTIYIGLFANNEGTIQNLGIDETSKVESGSYTGSICATNSGTILNCYNRAAITSSTNNSYSGGICAYNSGDISNCSNEAIVSAKYYSGGICGYSKTGTISDCHNIGDITVVLKGHQVFSGGICGSSESGSFINCYNNGSVSSSVNWTYYIYTSGSNYSECSSYSGGICGNNGSAVNNCFNSGTVTSSADYNHTENYSSGTISATSYTYCGGICGVSRNDIVGSYNIGELSSTAISKADNTYYYTSDYTTSEIYCNAYAKAESYSYNGGICGYHTIGAISDCYNAAKTTSSTVATADYYKQYSSYENISGKNKTVYRWKRSWGTAGRINCNGGIVGSSDNGTINGCYNVGNATYGIRGTGLGEISNCYYLNTAGSSNTGAKALTNAQLQLEMCMPNFDFENTWIIYHEADYKYPQLRSNIQDNKRLIGIDVTLPDKTAYLVGEEFDPSGMVVTGRYDDDTTKEFTDYEITGFTGELGRNNITVTVGDKSAVFYVTVHDAGEWKTEKEPTCTESGEKKLYCTDCGALLDTEEIPAKGHTEVIDKGHDATCTESGLTDGSHCSVCNTILTEQEVIPAKGHTPYLNWETIKSPTCIAHGEKVRYCSVCGEVAETADMDVTDHQPVIDEGKDATCLASGLTEGSHCSVCHTVLVPQEVIQPKGHEWDDGEITKQPTCTTTGEKIYYCKNCDKTKSETIPKLGHDYSAEYTIDKQPTCTEDGVKSRHCSRCTAVTDRIVIPKTDHNPSSEWTVVRKATTTEEGLEERYCLDCGTVVDSRAIPILPPYVLGDVDGDGEVTILDATCIQRRIAELSTFAYNEKAADSDEDGEVTILDATCIQRHLAELKTNDNIGKPIK